jgi:Flp pilus assembly protein TadG
MDRLRRFPQDARATAAIEFAGAAMFLVTGLLNATDLGYYMYQRMEVENAAHAGAQAAWKTCYDQSSMLPATENCVGLTGAITTAIQSTSLGTAVALASGYPTEGYYCVNSSNVLQSVGSLSAKPSDCSAAGSSTTSPGDYVQIEVTYAYSPLFAVSVMGLSSIRSIIKTSWMLLG